jgi:N-acetylmuramoyl-L-alanine amidase
MLTPQSFSVLFGLLSLIQLATPECPSIISRAQWGARPPRGTEAMKTPVPYVIVHHTVMGEGECSNRSECIEVMKDIQDLHMDTNGWDDIGYSLLVGGDGSVYEGRGWNRVGAHSPGYNDKSIGISVIGNFMDHLPSQAQMNLTQKLIECGQQEGYIIQNYTLYGHRDVRDTDCPGDKFYQEISTWPQFHHGDST